MSDLLTPEQRASIAAQLGAAKPAASTLLVSLAESVEDRREHEHPEREDWYCLNIVGYMGERMAPVLRRLLDAEAQLGQLRDRVAELEAERATAAADRDAQIIAWLGKKAREYRSTGSRQHALQADVIGVMASKISRGAVRPPAPPAPVEDPHDSTPDPLAYGPTGYRCGCGKDAHSNLTPCNPMTADEWNKRYPVGTPVLAYPGTRDDEPLDTVTRTPAWTLGHGAAVVSVEGESGGICLTHVDPIPGGAS